MRFFFRCRLIAGGDFSHPFLLVSAADEADGLRTNGAGAGATNARGYGRADREPAPGHGISLSLSFGAVQSKFPFVVTLFQPLILCQGETAALHDRLLAPSAPNTTSNPVPPALPGSNLESLASLPLVSCRAAVRLTCDFSDADETMRDLDENSTQGSGRASSDCVRGLGRNRGSGSLHSSAGLSEVECFVLCWCSASRLTCSLSE